jgi:hypothetical protein
MKRKVTERVVTLAGVCMAALVTVSSPASAQATAAESLDGVIVASGQSGDRVVVGSVIVGHGTFAGVGRIVETPNLAGDPENVSRDDLVFAGGTMRLVSTFESGSFSLNPTSCRFLGHVLQSARVDGGTGRFASATGQFNVTLTARGLAQREPDGSCSQTQVPLAEVDAFAMRGTLSF